MMNYDNLTDGEIFIIDWQFNSAGGFRKCLAELMSKSDTSNLNRLAKGYPEEVQAYLNYIGTKGWWADVRERAGV